MEWTGAKIKELRQRLGKTKTEFANMLHTTPTTLYRWEKNISRPRKPTLIFLELFWAGDKKWKMEKIAELTNEISALQSELLVYKRKEVMHANRWKLLQKRATKWKGQEDERVEQKVKALKKTSKKFNENFVSKAYWDISPRLKQALKFVQAEINNENKDMERLRKAFYRIEESIDMLIEFIETHWQVTITK